MSHNGSYTATLNPRASSGMPSHMLSSSISSLASSTSSRHPSSTSKIYRQASTLFLTRRLPEALSTVLPLITPPNEGNGDANEPAPVAKSSRNTRIKVWSLYITVLNAIVELEPDDGKEAFGTQEWKALCTKVRDGQIWEEVVQNGYHGVEGDVDADVVINLATLLLAHARTQTLNQKRLENYLAMSQTPIFDLSDKFSEHNSSRPSSRHRSPAKGTSTANTPRDLNSRIKILELYTLHVLLRNNEWDYAKEFISASPVLDDERREAFLQALQSLHDEQHEAERLEQEERERQDEQLRREIEEASRLRAENEAREAKRLAEERARREGSEVDYGIDKTPSLAGSTSSRRTEPRSRSNRPSGSARPSTSKTQAKSTPVAPPSLVTRAAAVITNIRALIERMSASLGSNPMLLMRLIAFIAGLIVMFGRKDIRDRVASILATMWNKVRATAGMGVKVSYL